jgi:ribosome-binding ATPase YchF (GTP1/OBG family)
MKVALIGLPKTGKTTIFNALTHSEHSTDKYAPPVSEAYVGIVPVADERVDRLSALYQPKKTIHATIEYHDFPGIFGREGDTADNNLLSELKSADAFLVVLKGFADEELDSLYAYGSPLQQLNHLEEEFILSDLIVAENAWKKSSLATNAA